MQCWWLFGFGKDYRYCEFFQITLLYEAFFLLSVEAQFFKSKTRTCFKFAVEILKLLFDSVFGKNTACI
jgi:hypothetical protein